MIGAAALAGVVALGIIGHKNNWWRKASQAAEDLKPKIPNESPEIPHTPNTPRKVDTPVDYSDISTIKGERSVLEDRSVAITQKDESGTVVREFHSQDGRTVRSFYDCDPTTGNPTKLTYFKEDGMTLRSVYDYDPTTGNPTKLTYYKDDVSFVIDLGPYNG